MAELFSCQQPKLLNGPVQFFLFLLGQVRHDRLKEALVVALAGDLGRPEVIRNGLGTDARDLPEVDF
jgi:hypothetical protein